MSVLTYRTLPDTNERSRTYWLVCPPPLPLKPVRSLLPRFVRRWLRHHSAASALKAQLNLLVDEPFESLVTHVEIEPKAVTVTVTNERHWPEQGNIIRELVRNYFHELGFRSIS